MLFHTLVDSIKDRKGADWWSETFGDDSDVDLSVFKTKIKTRFPKSEQECKGDSLDVIVGEIIGVFPAIWLSSLSMIVVRHV